MVLKGTGQKNKILIYAYQILCKIDNGGYIE